MIRKILQINNELSEFHGKFFEVLGDGGETPEGETCAWGEIQAKMGDTFLTIATANIPIKHLNTIFRHPKVKI